MPRNKPTPSPDARRRRKVAQVPPKRSDASTGLLDALTPKQRLFVSEYLKDMNATAAAIRAGYSARTADKIGSELLRKTRVAAAVDDALRRRAERCEVTADRVLKELAKLAFSDMADFAKWSARGIQLTDSTLLDKNDTAAVLEIVAGKFGPRLRLHSKEQALTTLARHLGMLRDKLEVSDDIADEKRIERLAAIFDAARTRRNQSVGSGGDSTGRPVHLSKISQAD